MIFISFSRGNRFKKKRFTPSFSRKPNYEGVFRVFANSGNAKTILKKIKEAEKDLNGMDKRIKDHPSSKVYQKELKTLYTKKYLNIINYWTSFRDYAKAIKAESGVIKGIENKLANVKNEWASIQKFLK